MAYKPVSDKSLIYTTVFLIVFGLVMVYSVLSVSTKNADSFRNQVIYACIGMTCLLSLMHVDYHFWQKPWVIMTLLAGAGAALIVVLRMDAINGAKRWLPTGIGSATFQPSEFTKLIMLMFIAWFLHKYEKEINKGRRLLCYCAVIGIFAALIAKEPDLGQALMLCAISAILLVIAGLNWKYIAIGILCCVLVAAVCYTFNIGLKGYQAERIATVLSPSADPQDAGWHINQALIAVGSGGISGLGLGNSIQKLSFVYAASSDFIFSIIGEELGLLGTGVVVVAFMFFFYRGMRIAFRSQDRFGFYLGAGITLMIILQGFTNISVVLAILPTKGIALPFISQGGSSLIMNLAATGILLNMSYQNKFVGADE